LSEPLSSQAGKDITIYTKFNPEQNKDNWCRILALIDKQLLDAGVELGSMATGKIVDERKFIDTTRFTYRYEGRMKPMPDPYANISLHQQQHSKTDNFSSLSLTQNK
jgi:hypothetical protein